MLRPTSCACCLVLAAANAAAPADNAEIVRRGKAATAMVEVKVGSDKGIGSAFCIEPSGYFITSYHVANPLVREAGSSTATHRRAESITLVLNSGEKDQGKVVCLVRGGIPGAALNFAVPVSKLVKLIEKPEIIFEPRPVPLLKAAENHRFDIEIKPFIRPEKASHSVEMILADPAGGETPRRFAATPDGNDRFHATAPLLPARPGPAMMRARITYSGGYVDGQVADMDLKIDGNSVKLSEIARIDDAGVACHDGRRLDGKIVGLGQLEVALGDAKLAVDATKAKCVDLDPPAGTPAQIGYTICVKLGDHVVAERTGFIDIEMKSATAASPPSRSAPPIMGPAPLADARVDLNLPGPVDNVVVGGGGRYLLLQMSKLRQLAVFDVALAKIVKSPPLVSDNVLVAASRDKMVIVMPDKNLMQRWDLKTLVSELAVSLPPDLNPSGVALGHTSTGPVMLSAATGQSFWSLDELKQMEVDVGKVSHSASSSSRYPPKINASADGTTFTISRGSTTSRARVLTLSGNTAQEKYLSSGSAELLPSSDGQFFFTINAMYSADLNPLSKGVLGDMYCVIPAVDPAYFIGVAHKSDRPQVGSSRAAAYKATFFTTVDQRAIFTLDDLDEMVSSSSSYSGSPSRYTAMPLNRRVFFIPQSDLLVTLLDTKGQLVLRRVNVMAEARKTGENFLFVASYPVSTASKGARYEYHMDVKSNRGGVKFKLETAPAGMAVSPDGRITWRVPADFEAGRAPVMALVSDATGREIYHGFAVQVRSARGSPCSAFARRGGLGRAWAAPPARSSVFATGSASRPPPRGSTMSPRAVRRSPWRSPWLRHRTPMPRTSALTPNASRPEWTLTSSCGRA